MTLHSRSRTATLAAALAMAASTLSLTLAQSPTPTQPDQAPATQPTPPPQATTPGGTVIFSRDLPLDPDSPQTPSPETPPTAASIAQPPPQQTQAELAPGDDDPLKVTDAERAALTFTAYDLDVHLTPATAGISVRAGLTVRNDSPAPLTRLILQITSSTHWDSFSAITPATPTRPAATSSRLDFKTRRIATDADHTGWAQEAVVTLPQPLAPGASIALTTLYSGAIPQSAERLERIGAPPNQATATDWDAIAAATPLLTSSSNATPDAAPSTGGGTALRGFGNVLWYPVASAPLFLGDGARLFQAVGRSKLRQQAATVRLRLAVEYTGDPPDAAFFCGRREPLIPIHDNPDQPIAESSGIATTVFAPQPLGFRTPSLFVTPHPSSPAGTTANPGLIAAVTENFDALPAYSAAAALVEPLLTDWFGPHPQTTLNLLDHPGQPFEDGALLLRSLQIDVPAKLAPSLAHSLTHVWIHSSRPWIDEGLAQFAGLLWTERSAGRAAALNELQQAAHTLALAEPGPASSESPDSSPPSPSVSSSAAGAPGQTLIDASDELYYRTKATAVWWMLRAITGDEALKQALQAYRLNPTLDRDPEGLERTLEKFSHKDLSWFFESWVYNDRGLPDLSIVNVTPRQLEAHNGLPAGWLVSVEVRNDGDAEAEVPFIVRSAPGSGAAGSTETQTLRIPGHSSLSRRVVFAGTPNEVQINDGGVPETRVSIHTRQLVLPGH